MAETHDAHEVSVRLRVNGETRTGTCEPRTTLVDHLRDGLGLTGTHVGCEHGVCGACTVLLDGDAIRSCLVFAVQAQGHDVETIEGLTPADGGLTDVQEAFRECHGLQCGFCTPGFVISVTAMLEWRVPRTRQELAEALSGNLCRCTGYQHIVDAVAQVIEARGGELH